YRIVIDKNKKLNVIEIDEKESNLKLVKITGKSLIKGKTQLNCSDSRNVLVEKDEYRVGDSLLIDLPGQNIKQNLKMEKGGMMQLIGGKHMGDYGVLESIEGNNIVYKSSKGKIYQTSKKYAFVIGKDKPVIKIFENKK
ncbi:30S ribosomal protein S4e, partial [Candidatus Woesearchaeota archaeon]|nr:30S ribosomal protein S4e [Candidatus Woesearchaeota archaeon]